MLYRHPEAYRRHGRSMSWLERDEGDVARDNA